MACGKPVAIKLATFTQVERSLDRFYDENKSKMADIVEGMGLPGSDQYDSV